MLDSLTGRVLALEPDLQLQVGPATFRLEITARTRDALPRSEAEVLVFTELVVREDAMELLGFARPEERVLYRLITGVSGIGKRLALAVLSDLGPEELARCVVSGDEKSLTAIGGIGKKTASRLLLELGGKLDEFLPTGGIPATAPTLGDDAPDREEALLALTALGMNRASAQRALEAVGEEELPVEEMIRRALAAAGDR